MDSSIEYLVSSLKKARKKKGLSQRDLGAKTGLPQSHISKIEKGLVDLQTSSLIQLARTLEMELMLVPRQLIPTVKALLRNDPSQTRQRPMYQPDPDEEEEDEG